MLLIKRAVCNVGNNQKKGSWEQATVGLLRFRSDYAETIIIIIFPDGKSRNNFPTLENSEKTENL